MKRSNRLILLIGVFLAALAFVFIIILLQGGGTSGPGANASAPPAKVATVIAARDIALGVTITTDMLTSQELDAANVLPGAYGDKTQVVGQIARQSVTKGQQVTTGITNPTNQSFVVPAGFSALAVQVDQVSGAGTLIKPGDYVDVVAQISPAFPLNYFVKTTDLAPAADGAKYDPTSVKVLLQGIQVVTTLLTPPPTAQTGTTTAPAQTGTALNGQAEIVILAVTQQQAEVIKFAQVDGVLSLALRSPKDFVDANGQPIVPEKVKTTGIVLKTLVDSWGVLPPLPVIVAPPVPVK